MTFRHTEFILRTLVTTIIVSAAVLGVRGAAGDPPLPDPHYRLTRLVTGWLPYWLNKEGEGAGWKTVQGHLNMLDQVSFFSAEADGASGNINLNLGASESNINEEIAELHENDVQAFITVTHFGHMHDLLIEPDSLGRISDGLLRILDRYNLDGVDIDFEDFSDKDPADTQRYTDFMTALANRLHQRQDSFGYPTTVVATILARTQRGHFTYCDEHDLALSPVDQVRVMAYDEYSPGSAKAGACAPLPWVSQVANFLRTTDAPTWKFVLGVPGYGYRWPVKAEDDWTTTAKGLSQSYLKAQTLMAQYHAQRLWDRNGQSPYFTYTSEGHPWIAFYEDSESWYRKIDQIVAPATDSSPVGGISTWALGYEDPASWHKVDARLAPNYSVYAAIGLCYTHYGGGARFGQPTSSEQNCGNVLPSAWNDHFGRKQVFENATFYYKWGDQRAHYLQGALLKSYEANGGPEGPLGFPTSDGGDSATSVNFEHGTLLSPANTSL